MIGTGMGTSGGLGNIGIYGQQPWQEEARSRKFNEAYGRGLQMQTTSPMGAGPLQQWKASSYASQFIPRGATLGGGATLGTGYASSGAQVPSSITGGMQQDWMRNIPQYQFPMMGMR
jgi:hypothetical protein